MFVTVGYYSLGEKHYSELEAWQTTANECKKKKKITL